MCTAAGACLWLESRAAAPDAGAGHDRQCVARRLRRAALAAAGVGVMMRPSSAAFWVPLGEQVLNACELVERSCIRRWNKSLIRQECLHQEGSMFRCVQHAAEQACHQVTTCPSSCAAAPSIARLMSTRNAVPSSTPERDATLQPRPDPHFCSLSPLLGRGAAPSGSEYHADTTVL